MSRCKVCNRQYEMNFLARFQGEGYCPLCEEEIVTCLMELENPEEEEDEENIN